MLTLQLIPHTELKGLESDQKVNKILRIVKQNKITLIEGKLNPQEETKLIEKTMEEIDKSFKGVEICSMDYDNNNKNFFGQVKDKMVNMIMGGRSGMTVIGPANIIKQIKRNPKKIELLTNIKG